MKKGRVLLPVLCFSLLCGCAAGAVEPAVSMEVVAPVPKLTCRVVDGAEIGELLLAAESGEVYSLSVGDLTVLLDGERATADALRDGMLVEVSHSGDILETWPAQFAEALTISGETASTDDRCGLYLQVLEDLWNEDPGLNDGGLTYLGMDLSGLTGLTQGEKNALAWRFAQLRGLSLLTGTFDQLIEQGYITSTPLEGGEYLFYEWPDGILLSITGGEELCGLPKAGEDAPPVTQVTFDAQKWRTGLGAYYFTDCAAQRDETGGWSYTVGAHAVS